MGLTFKRVHGNAGDLEIGKKHCIWSGIVYSDHNGIPSGDSYIGSKRSKSDYLSVSRQFVTWLTLWIVC